MGGNPGPSQQVPPVTPAPLQQDKDEDQAGPSSWGNPPSPPDVDYVHHLSPTYSYTSQKSLADMCQEGGALFINFLLAKVISPDDERDKSLPATSRVREWHFRDILQLPKVQKEEWKAACHEELESLRECRVFELTDLPKGRKVIKNRWVFNIKSDGRKKA